MAVLGEQSGSMILTNLFQPRRFCDPVILSIHNPDFLMINHGVCVSTVMLVLTVELRDRLFSSCKLCLTEMGRPGLIKDPLELMGIFPSLSARLKITFFICNGNSSSFPALRTSCYNMDFYFYDLMRLKHERQTSSSQQNLLPTLQYLRSAFELRA